jgi:hypothetical protein
MFHVEATEGAQLLTNGVALGTKSSECNRDLSPNEVVV